MKRNDIVKNVLLLIAISLFLGMIVVFLFIPPLNMDKTISEQLMEERNSTSTDDCFPNRNYLIKI